MQNYSNHDRFFIDSPAAQEVWCDQLAADRCQADLSRAFRVYYRLRPWIPLALRHWLQRGRPVHAPDAWFLPEQFLSVLGRTIDENSPGLPMIHPWPHGARFGLVLTHDVETEEGLKNIAAIAAIEEELGFRSAWNIVPYKYKLDHGLLAELRSRSFEIGIHGYNHDGRLYSSEETFRQRAEKINEALRQLNASGFRSPMMHRNLEWLQLLDIQYDSSYFDTDPFQPMPGGVGSLWPFIAGRFVELPYTLPQDHTLLVVLKEKTGRIWEEKLQFIARHHGMALMLTHPDYLNSPERFDLYRRFLESVKERGDYWHALPHETAKWWRERDESKLHPTAGGWAISGPASTRGTVACIASRCGSLNITQVMP